MNSNARFMVVCAGRRWGKGESILTRQLIKANDGKACWWICPSYNSTAYYDALGKLMPIVYRSQGMLSWNGKERAIRPVGYSGFMQFKTAEEPDALRGTGIDEVAIDEAAHIPKLEEIWLQNVLPTLGDRRGKAIFISTPRGFNYFHELYRRGQTRPGWRSYHFRTLDNPTLPPGTYDEIAAEMPELVRRQELDAEFVQLAGALFKRENIVIAGNPPEPLRKFRSWDLAYSVKTTADYTAGVRGGMTGDGTLVIDHVVHGRWETGAGGIIRDTALSDGPGVTQCIEVVGAQLGTYQALVSDPHLAGITILPAHVLTDKIQRAMPLLGRTEQRKVMLKAAPWNMAFLDELCAFPESDHDDIVDATTGLLAAIGHGSQVFAECV